MHQAAQAFCHLGSACSCKPGYAEDFPLPDLKRNIIEQPGLAQVFHLQNRPANLYLCLRVHFIHLAPDHPCNQFFFRNITDCCASDIRAVADNRHAVSDFKNLLHAVADIHHGNAACLEPCNRPKQRTHVLARQCCGRLVEDKDICIIGQRLGNFHHLFCRHAKVIHLCVKADILVNAKEFKYLLRFCPHSLVIDIVNAPKDFLYRLRSLNRLVS